MTAAAARKKREDFSDPAAQDRKVSAAGLWIDESLLPTTLAKKGPPKQVAAMGLSAPKTKDRLLHLADIALKAPRVERRTHDRRKKQGKFNGVERRLTR